MAAALSAGLVRLHRRCARAAGRRRRGAAPPQTVALLHCSGASPIDDFYEAAAADAPDRRRGTCSKWLEDRGFGFIEPLGGGAEVFVHWAELNAEGHRELGVGEEVEYTLHFDRPGRPRALHVTAPGGGYVRGNPWWYVRRGVVTRWLDDEGFGWIRPEDGSEAEVFVHQREVYAGGGHRRLVVGAQVEFRTLKDKRGRWTALKVTGPGGAPIISRTRDRTPRPAADGRRPAGGSERGTERSGGSFAVAMGFYPPKPPINCVYVDADRIRIRNTLVPKLAEPLIDVGVDLGHRDLRDDRRGVLERAAFANVPAMIVTSTSLAATEKALDLVNRHIDRLFCTAGVRARDAHTATDAVLRELERLIDGNPLKDKIVAVGECGLDFALDFPDPATQERVLRAQVLLAQARGLPLFCHERAAHDAFVRVLRECDADWTRVCVRGFAGSEAELERYVALGCRVGISGALNARDARGEALRACVARRLPVERLLLETDAPFMLPFGGGRRRVNEPCYLPLVARQLADLYDCDVNELARATTANARRFFRLPAEVARRGNGASRA